MSEVNYSGKTFFSVAHLKSLENLAIPGIAQDFQLLEAERQKVSEEGKEQYKASCEAIAQKVYNVLKESTKADAHYLSFCRSKEGVLHFHICSTYSTAKRRVAVSKELGNAHVEEMRGTKEQAMSYVLKEGQWEEKGEEVLAVVGDKNGIKENRGQRNDLLGAFEEFDKAVKDPHFNFHKYMYDHMYSTQIDKAITKRYERYTMLTAVTQRDVQVIFVEGEAGDGKSKYPYITEGAVEKNEDGSLKLTEGGNVILNDRAKDFFIPDLNNVDFPFNGYNGESIIILDELRPRTVKYNRLFQWLSGDPVPLNIKGGITYPRWTKVYITTAYPMHKWWSSEGFDEDKDHEGLDRIREQFDRRVTEYVRLEHFEVKCHTKKKTQRADERRKPIEAYDEQTFNTYVGKYVDLVKSGKTTDAKEMRDWFCKQYHIQSDLIDTFNQTVDACLLFD